MKKVWAMIIVSLMVYTVVDIGIWRSIFEDNQRYLSDLSGLVYKYQWTWQLILTGFLVVGSLALWPEKKQIVFFVLATTTLAHSGLEDLLYYWLDLRPVPLSLPWLNNSLLIVGMRPVTFSVLMFSALLWILFWVVVTALIAYKVIVAEEWARLKPNE